MNSDFGPGVGDEYAALIPEIDVLDPGIRRAAMLAYGKAIRFERLVAGLVERPGQFAEGQLTGESFHLGSQDANIIKKPWFADYSVTTSDGGARSADPIGPARHRERIEFAPPLPSENASKEPMDEEVARDQADLPRAFPISRDSQRPLRISRIAEASAA